MATELMRVDLLLTDVVMPLMKGTQLAMRIQSIMPSTGVGDVGLPDRRRGSIRTSLYGQALQLGRARAPRPAGLGPALGLGAACRSSFSPPLLGAASWRPYPQPLLVLSSHQAKHVSSQNHAGLTFFSGRLYRLPYYQEN